MAVTLSVLIAGTVGCNNTSRDADPDKKPAITIGKKTFTAAQFQDELKRILHTSEEEGHEDLAEALPQEMDGLRKNLVKQLIEERLILLEAEKLAFTVSDAEVTEDMNSLWDDPTDEEFKAVILEKYSSMDNWKAEIRKKLIIKKIVEELVNSKIMVSITEARKYYKEHNSVYTTPAQVHARMIVVETKQEARAAKRKLANESFEDVARAVSTGLEASRGGDLGFFGEGDMPPEFEEVVFKMTVGRISNIIKTPYGHHIFKVEEKRKAGLQSFNEVKNEILNKLKREKFERAYRSWITTLQENTHIEVNEDQLLIKDTNPSERK